jgi:hypothetical protein
MAFAVLLAIAGVLSLLILPNSLNVKLNVITEQEMEISVKL